MEDGIDMKNLAHDFVEMKREKKKMEKDHKKKLEDLTQSLSKYKTRFKETREKLVMQ